MTGIPDTLRRPWLWAALSLSGLTIAYNLAEAAVALWAGEAAGSIALIGFGLDSLIECTASGFAFRRIRLELRGGANHEIAGAENLLRRVVGWSFLALALYLAVKSAWNLWVKAVPDESLVGIALAAVSAVVMPALAWGKLKAADRLGSRALRSEAKETIACSLLSIILLVGLGLNAWLGWWWADPLAALAMLPWLIREGREGIRGEACEDCHA